MNSALAIALATVCMASLAGAWWATKQIASMASALAGLMSSMSSMHTELLTVSIDRDRNRFEATQLREAFSEAQKRIENLEGLLDEHASTLSAGLAGDDVRGRLLRRAEAAANTATGSAVSADASQRVSPQHTASGASAPMRADLPDV